MSKRAILGSVVLVFALALAAVPAVAAEGFTHGPIVNVDGEA